MSLISISAFSEAARSLRELYTNILRENPDSDHSVLTEAVALGRTGENTASTGDDVITPVSSNSYVFAGLGNDTLNEGTTASTLGAVLHDGDDHFIGDINNANAATVFGGDGNDTFVSSGDALFGEEGNDSFTAVGALSDTLHGGSGEDTIDSGEANDLVSGGQGADLIFAGRGDDIVNGDSNNDMIFGGNGDLVDLDDGNDQLFGGNGDDIIFGNSGNDTLIGGQDTVDLDDGADTLNGGVGDDLILGNAGDDQLIGASGNDELFGGLGDDVIFGGNTSVDANDGADTINGGAGEDTIFGNGGDDVIFGGTGMFDETDSADVIYGGFGNDTIFGNAGDDQLIGAQGNDDYFGGLGDDTINLDALSGNDVVHGFTGEGQTGGDLIRIVRNLNESNITDFDSLMARASNQGDDTLFDLGDGNTVLVTGVSSDEFSADDFVFVDDFSDIL